LNQESWNDLGLDTEKLQAVGVHPKIREKSHGESSFSHEVAIIGWA
jgi:hypothetical protein